MTHRFRRNSARMSDWYHIEADPAHIKRERKKAQDLKKSQWWKNILGQGKCHYCKGKFSPKDLTMDHVVPVARGGQSVKSNVVPACKKCNAEKKLHTPVDLILKNLDSGPSED